MTSQSPYGPRTIGATSPAATQEVFNGMTRNLLAEILGTRHPPLLHIGYPKALSTWLQQELFNYRHGFAQIIDPIGARLGLIDPKLGEFTEGTLRYVLNYVRGIHGAVPRQVPVITSEYLSGNMPTGGHDAVPLADRLAASFPDARVLIVVREQRRMLRSLYTSLVRNEGYPHSIRRIIDPIGTPTVPRLTAEYLDYADLVEYYQRHYSPERVLVLPMELFLEDPGLFVRRIADFAGGPAGQQTDPDRLRPETVTNPGSGLTALTLMRFANKYAFRTAYDYRGVLRDDHDRFRSTRVRLTRQLDRIVPGPIDRLLETHFARYLADQLEERFAASNRRLAEHAAIDLDRYGYQL